MSFFSSCEYQERLDSIDGFLLQLLKQKKSAIAEYSPSLFEAVHYSLMGAGKRFRPTLSLALAEDLKLATARVLPVAAAIEMIHTYSLIHDDLPCMDNDDFRRGKPTNHKMFGEATALLTGDALLTLAFEVLSQQYQHDPQVGLNLVMLLSQRSGVLGMIGGQALDMAYDSQNISTLKKMHLGKTAALISACVEAPGLILSLEIEKQRELQEMGFLLGLAFQIKDDILDAQEPKKIELKNYVACIGLEQTQKELLNLQDQLLSLLQSWPQIKSISQYMHYNLERTV